MRILAVALLVCLAVPSVVAQDGANPDLRSLYLHNDDAGNWLDNVLEAETDSGGILLDSTGNIGPEPVGIAFPLLPALDRPLAFASGSDIDIVITLSAAFLGGAAPTTPPGPATVTVTLAAGGTVIGTGSVDGTMPDGIVNPTTAFTFALAPAVLEVDGSDNLVLTVDVETTAPSGPFFLQTAGDSTVALPLVAADAPSGTLSLATAEDAATADAGSAAEFDLTVSGTTGRSFTLSTDGLPEGFAATYTPAEGTLEGSPINTVLSVATPSAAASGEYVFNATLISAGEQVAEVALTLTVTGGSVSPSPSPGSPPSPSPGASPGASPSPSPSPGASPDEPGGTTSSEDKGSPGFEMVLALMAALAALFVVRRRQK